MPKKPAAIPVNPIAERFGLGMGIERQVISDIKLAAKNRLKPTPESNLPHRHDAHSFFLVERGTISLEIDFKLYTIAAVSMIYLHPDQVHRILKSKDLLVSSWAITNENLNPEYLELLQNMVPAQALRLNKEDAALFSVALSLGIAYAERKTDKLYRPLLKDSCNALVALCISQYFRGQKPVETFSRTETISRAFRKMLELHYQTVKQPQEYARRLNISTAYLNECVKAATGYSVTHQIQQRVILEARRLLYHTDKSVKEIATELGYADYPYFSRLFSKQVKMTALSFRAKNRD